MAFEKYNFRRQKQYQKLFRLAITAFALTMAVTFVVLRSGNGQFGPAKVLLRGPDVNLPQAVGSTSIASWFSAIREAESENADNSSASKDLNTEQDAEEGDSEAPEDPRQALETKNSRDIPSLHIENDDDDNVASVVAEDGDGQEDNDEESVDDVDTTEEAADIDEDEEEEQDALDEEDDGDIEDDEEEFSTDRYGNEDEEEIDDEAKTTTKKTTKPSEDESSILGEKVDKSGKAYLEAVKGCNTLQCLKKAYINYPRNEKQFNFPHAIIVGWQKTATTSLYYHLKQHPDVIDLSRKEPEFFTESCDFDPPHKCGKATTDYYINRLLSKDAYLKHGGEVMTFEASTHYGMSGPLIADKVYDTMPWLKIIISLREPISRAMSLLVHMADPSAGHNKGCLSQKGRSMYQCLAKDSQIVPNTKKSTEASSYTKITGSYNYSRPVASWFSAYPKGQVFLVQFEALTDEDLEDTILTRFKKFLNLNPEWPKKGLQMRNSRKQKIRPEGWPMKRHEYEQLVEMVKPDAKEIARLAEENGFGTAKEWYGRWEAVWQENLDNCDDDGNCSIIPS